MSAVLPEHPNGLTSPDLLINAGPSTPIPMSVAAMSPRSSFDDAEPDVGQLKHDLAVARQEKEVLGNQYRSLLGKLTAMRQSLDAVGRLGLRGTSCIDEVIQEELDRRETAINTLSAENSSLQGSMTTLRSELVGANQESSSLQAQLTQLRSQSDSSSSDVLSLTREMRELRGEMERLRVEREEWEAEVGRERERREIMEEEVRHAERRYRDGRREWEMGKENLLSERERARNLQEVLGEFQAGRLRRGTGRV